MNTNPLKPIIFLCLMVLLNACGIGRYHNLNLVRPDKKTTTTLVKAKHRTIKMAEVIKVDSVNAQINEEEILTKKANNVSEQKETLANPFIKKPTLNTKKVELGLKEKVVLSFLKTEISKRKKPIIELNINTTKPTPCDGGMCALGAFFICFPLLIIAIIVGVIVAFENLVLGLLLILGLSIAIFLLFLLLVYIAGR